MSEDIKKTEDVLDQVKKADKSIKQALLIRRLADLKELAREVLEAKEETTAILEDIGIHGDDVKRVIDYINSLEEVQLSESDKKNIRESVKNEGKQKREEIQKQIEKAPNFLGYVGSPSTSSSSGPSVGLSSVSWTYPENSTYTVTSGTGTTGATSSGQVGALLNSLTGL